MKTLDLRAIKKLYFGYEDISRALGITPRSAMVSASRYVKQDLLIRVRRNLYVLAERWRTLDREEEFRLANIAQVPSYISLTTALQYYELTTQVQRNFVESIAVKRTKEIRVQDTTFNYVKMNKDLYFGFSKEKDVFLASPEKALLDAVYLTSLNRYNFDVTSLDIDKFDMKELAKMAERFPLRTRERLRGYGLLKKT